MIPDETVSRVRERADIVEVVGEHVELRRAGANLKGLCPFHQEKTPSFNVSPSRQMYHCFGCGEGGDAIAFLMRYEGRTFSDAVRELGRRYGVQIEERAVAPGALAARQRRQAEQEKLLSVMERVALFYRERLLGPEGRSALDYLRGRGLTPEAEERFGIGHAPGAWDTLAAALPSLGVSPQEAERLGLVVERRGGGGFYDRLRDRVVFPVKDAAGRVVAFGGRALPGAPDDAPKYVNSPESPVFSKGQVLYGLDLAREAMRRGEPAVVVEGYLDVVSLHSHGIGSAVAPMGTALTSEQAVLLRRFGGRSGAVVLLFDGDEAGAQAARRAQPSLSEAGLSARVALLPVAEDPDTFVRARGPEAVRRLVDDAAGLVEHLIDAAAAGSNLDGRSKAQAIRELWPVLSSVKDPLERDLYKSRVAAAFGVSEELVFRYLRGGEPAEAKPGASEPADRASPRARAEAAVAGALLVAPELAADAVRQGALDLVRDSSVRWVVERLSRLGQGETAASIVAEAPDESLERHIRAQLMSTTHSGQDEARRAVDQALAKLRQLAERDRARQLQTQVNQAELEGDLARAERLAQEKLQRKRAAGADPGGNRNGRLR